jgi:hypothetical protein
LQSLRAFFEEIPFWRMLPANDGFVRGLEGATVRALAEPGNIYAVYVHHGRLLKDAKPRYQVDQQTLSRELSLQLPPGSYLVRWRDTRNGAEVKSESLTVTDEVQGVRVASPVYSEDIALVIRALKPRGR